MQAWLAEQALELAAANLHFFPRLAQFACALGRTKILGRYPSGILQITLHSFL